MILSAIAVLGFGFLVAAGMALLEENEWFAGICLLASGALLLTAQIPALLR